MRVLAAFVCGVYLDLVCAIPWPRDYSNEMFIREMGKGGPKTHNHHGEYSKRDYSKSV